MRAGPCVRVRGRGWKRGRARESSRRGEAQGTARSYGSSSAKHASSSGSTLHPARVPHHARPPCRHARARNGCSRVFGPGSDYSAVFRTPFPSLSPIAAPVPAGAAAAAAAARCSKSEQAAAARQLQQQQQQQQHLPPCQGRGRARAPSSCFDISGSIPKRCAILTTTRTGPASPDRIRRRDSRGPRDYRQP